MTLVRLGPEAQVDEVAASLDTQVTLATTATVNSPPATYPITANGAFAARGPWARLEDGPRSAVGSRAPRSLR